MDTLVAQRPITEQEATIPKSLFGWQYWFAPAIFSLATPLSLLLADEVGLKIIFALALGSSTFAIWLNRLRIYRPFKRDLAVGVVAIIDGRIEWVSADNSGLQWAQIAGLVVRIPPDTFRDLQEGTTAQIVFLPETRLAVDVTVRYGIGPL